VVVLVFTVTDLNAQKRAPYNKTLADGSRIFHSTTTLTELRSRPRSANPDAPAEEIYTDKEWKIVIDTLRLQPAGATNSAVIWSEKWEYPSDLIASLPDTRGQLYVADVLLRKDRAFVLFYDGFYTYKVANIVRDGDRWDKISETPLAKKSETRPVVDLKFSENDKGEIIVVYLDGEKGNWKRRSLIFTLQGDKWRQR